MYSLGLFNALNPAMVFFCPWDCWFWLHKQKRFQIPAAKDSAYQTSSPQKSITTTVEKVVRGAPWGYLTRGIHFWSPFVNRAAGTGATSKSVPNSAGKKLEFCPKKLHLPPSPSPPTIRTPKRVFSAPFKHSESIYGLHLSMGPLVLALLAKMFQTCQG
jgi:hypothetical protein